MRIRLGYVAIALRLENCSPSKTVTLKNINRIEGYSNQINRLIRIARENLESTLRILKANAYDDIKVYRFTSKLVPLCTHPQFHGWDYIADLKDAFEEIGSFVKRHQMRVSLHPDHFTLLNSPHLDVQKASRIDLEYHSRIIEAMKLGEEVKLVMHAGGKYEDKKLALTRFKTQFKELPAGIRNRIVIENDDRCYNAAEVLHLAQELSIPMVMDIHHHQILNQGEEISELIPEIFLTWKGALPKIHISSPKGPDDPRTHADFIEVDRAMDFLNIARSSRQDFDLMIEAKQKDLALFKLGKDLATHQYQLENNGEIELN